MDEFWNADRKFREGFASIVSTAMKAHPELSKEQIAETVKPCVAQGNPGGVYDLANARGWVHPEFATAVFRVLSISECETLGCAYDNLKKAVNGRSEPYYRRHHNE